MAGVSVTAGLCSRVDPSMPKVSENEMISNTKVYSELLLKLFGVFGNLDKSD